MKTLRMLSMVGAVEAADDLEAKQFQVLKAGDYYDPRYGKFKITPSLLSELKRNFDEKTLGIDVALDVGHEPGKGAVSWIKSLEVRDGGLWATFHNFSEAGKKLFREKVFRYFSVEYGPLEKVASGDKVTIPDVLKGIALTNRPVIKGMQPTFLSEDAPEEDKKLDNSSQSPMNAIKKYAERILARGTVTREELTSFDAMLAEIPEADRKEFADARTKVEAEVVKTEAEAKKLADAEAAKKLEEGKTTDVKLTEANAKIEEQGKKLSVLETEAKERTLAESVQAVTLSDKNLTGFAADKSDAVKEFVRSLSDEQRAKFQALVPEVRTVTKAQLSETGHAGSGKAEASTKLAEATKRAKETAAKPGETRPEHVILAEIIASEGLSASA